MGERALEGSGGSAKSFLSLMGGYEDGCLNHALSLIHGAACFFHAVF